MNTIQSSKYTSKNLWTNSLKVAATILENTASVFFKPNGIIVYTNEPHYVANIVLGFFSFVIHT